MCFTFSCALKKKKRKKIYASIRGDFVDCLSCRCFFLSSLMYAYFTIIYLFIYFVGIIYISPFNTKKESTATLL